MSGLQSIGGKQNITLTLQFYQLIECRLTVTKVEAKSHLTFLRATSPVLKKKIITLPKKDPLLWP